ncbi:hypothetical protein [Pseudomonas oryzihabitans]|uniref:hypothetical protein n=1 Tax=Pseudomonas oryzihabitans TaxID=47885 RepID=UPI00286223A9|nr:hypothetical protein [Pseudomonas psychrotolerans]MDR6680612.1 hypothetical protein [Pseudomonas psychrotolerans]
MCELGKDDLPALHIRKSPRQLEQAASSVHLAVFLPQAQATAQFQDPLVPVTVSQGKPEGLLPDSNPVAPVSHQNVTSAAQRATKVTNLGGAQPWANQAIREAITRYEQDLTKRLICQREMRKSAAFTVRERSGPSMGRH